MSNYVQPDIEADDGLGDDIAGSETTSLAPSLHEYVEQNGRRYHVYFGPDKNPMPTDDLEQERLDIIHEFVLLATGDRKYFAPLDNPQNVLDLGTGTGIWAVDFAWDNPQAQVRGIDLSPIQPGWVPPNCRFEVDDFELEWNYRQPFDYIHARMIAQSVSNWEYLLSEGFRNLTPGGWFELSEAIFETRCDDGTMPDNWPPTIVQNKICEALERLNRLCPNGPALRQLLENAGFVDVQVKTFKLPIGPWPKDPMLKQAGAMGLTNSETGAYESYALQLCTKVLGMGEKETEELCEAAKAAHKSPEGMKVHMYVPYVVVYGRKPE